MGAALKKYVNKTQLEPKCKDNSIEDMPIKNSRIFLATISANLASLAIGTCFSWSSPVGPKLTSDDTSDSPLDRPLTANENAWISSIFTIGALITSFISGPLSDKIGRKKVLLFSSLFFILGYIILLVANEFWILILGRIILGFGSSLALGIIPIYVSEISTDQLRSVTVPFLPLFMCIGSIYVFCIGPYVSYTALQYFCLFVPLVFDIAFIFMPESPYYYVAKGQRAEASKTLQFLRGQDELTVESELLAIEYLVTNSAIKNAGLLEIVKTPGNRKTLLISFGLTFFQQCSGYNIAVFYTQLLFEGAQINIDAAIATIIVGVTQFFISGIAPIIVNKFGRRTILLYAIALMSICEMALGYFFFSQIVLNNTNGIKWLPLTALVFSSMAYMVGIGPVPWVIFSEIFPPSTKAVAAALNTTVNWLTAFVVVLLYPALDAMGTYYAFWMFAILCGLAYFFVLFVVPETKGLSLLEIQNKLNKTL